MEAPGVPVTVTEYQQWRAHLIDRIGPYCVYCDMPLTQSLQVEHVIAKNPPPGVAPGNLLAWENMLLACGPCNRAKSNKPTPIGRHYFPEENNTLLPFRTVSHTSHTDAMIVAPAVGITDDQRTRALATIGLLELDNIDSRKAVVDLRWKFRHQALLAAEAAFRLYSQHKVSPAFDLTETARTIATFAKSIGFFAVWHERFHSEPLVIEQLIHSDFFPGTAQECFDAADDYQLMPRQEDNVTDPF
jgi:hypothetical protein